MRHPYQRRRTNRVGTWTHTESLSRTAHPRCPQSSIPVAPMSLIHCEIASPHGSAWASPECLGIATIATFGALSLPAPSDRHTAAPANPSLPHRISGHRPSRPPAFPPSTIGPSRLPALPAFPPSDHQAGQDHPIILARISRHAFPRHHPIKAVTPIPLSSTEIRRIGNARKCIAQTLAHGPMSSFVSA